MATHDLPRETWQGFLTEFSRRHAGALVTIETVDAGGDPQIEAESLPLVGISYQTQGSETGTIQLLLGTEPNDYITHTIEAPKHVYHKTGPGILSDEVNAGEILEVTAASHPAITQLQFRPQP